jgi:hypothetical protein
MLRKRFLARKHDFYIHKENSMKKIVSMVGVGAMVIGLGLGSGFAQQATQQPGSNVAPTVSKQSGEMDKDKALAPKAATEVKSPTTSAPVGKAAEKAPEKAMEVKSAAPAPTPAPFGKASEKATDKTITSGKGADPKAGKEAQEKSDPKHLTSAKPSESKSDSITAEKKCEQDTSAKPHAGKEAPKVDESKPAVK